LPYRAVIAGNSSFAVTLDGEERGLQPGESLVVPAGQELVLRNTGQTEATLLHVGVMVSRPPVQYNSAFITYSLLIASSGQMPSGATRMVVERMTMPPDSSLPPFTLAENQWVSIGEGTVGATFAGERLSLYWESCEEREFVSDYFPVVAAGTQVTLRNAGEEKLVLYRLTITPGAASAAGTPLAASQLPSANPLS
jgi:hypothetical protein